MKKVYIILVTVFLNLVVVSCTPTSIVDEAMAPQACCGDDGEIPPPPPPPPGGGGITGG